MDVVQVLEKSLSGWYIPKNNGESQKMQALFDENRLISATNDMNMLEFAYDYMGRRVSKKVFTGSTDNWSLITDHRFVYDGYEQIEKLDALNSNAVARNRIWGSGKIICDIHGSTPYYALSDANKNITEYIDGAGTIQAHYEYSPFGKLTKSSGPKAGDFDYQFSSEYHDDETGLVYYNYRYYSPELGRWLSRDPIGEDGGYNLYSMVANDPLGRRDNLGLAARESYPGGWKEWGETTPYTEGRYDKDPNWPPAFTKPNTKIEGKPCCKKPARPSIAVKILWSGKDSSIATLGKHIIFRNSIVVSRVDITDDDNAEDIKIVWYHCVLDPRSRSGHEWGYMRDSYNKRTYTVDTEWERFDLSSRYLIGVLVSLYSCEGWTGGSQKDGIMKRIFRGSQQLVMYSKAGSNRWVDSQAGINTPRPPAVYAPSAVRH